VTTCSRCGHLAEREHTTPPLCALCRDTRRDSSSLCVVARIQDLLSIERSHAFRGYYFVLGRLLSPLEGVGADQLPLGRLRERIRAGVTEVVIATPPSVDGEATALLLAHDLKGAGVKVTRLASGVPHGGDLEFADPVTIGRALAGRRGLD
jgi:recombination protein RecR